MRLATPFFLFIALVGVPRAQEVGDCALGTAEADLDVNEVQARVFNTGSLFYGNTTTRGDGYIVPKNRTCGGTLGFCSPIFAAGIWVGGQVNGELRAAGSTYNRFEFWPGPLDGEGSPPEDCAPYDRIYKVSRFDVERYYETGNATDDLRDWPHHLGAPVLDGDGI
ncbi:MAG TPA: hypothetical protein VD962_12805, partial [Rubricoccaceae bacterium]|nr:hypothetical protein [Rubricoccaceae bacterium]